MYARPANSTKLCGPRLYCFTYLALQTLTSIYIFKVPLPYSLLFRMATVKVSRVFRPWTTTFCGPRVYLLLHLPAPTHIYINIFKGLLLLLFPLFVFPLFPKVTDNISWVLHSFIHSPIYLFSFILLTSCSLIPTIYFF